jgi:uncharacterized protein YdeI (YjbR/CyaY-like superfamily)
MDTKNGLPIIAFESQAAWEGWLAENHESAPGLWLKLAKKASGIDSVTYSEAVDVALCYGWIDSQKAGFDDDYWLQRFTPRTAKSKWSKNNRQRVAELIEEGRMQPAGLREIERAQEDGRWERAYASQSNMTVPEDFQKELDDNPRAREFFANLNSSNRYAILYRIQDAKKSETRARRIAKFIDMLNAGETIY